MNLKAKIENFLEKLPPDEIMSDSDIDVNTFADSVLLSMPIDLQKPNNTQLDIEHPLDLTQCEEQKPRPSVGDLSPEHSELRPYQHILPIHTDTIHEARENIPPIAFTEEMWLSFATHEANAVNIASPTITETRTIA